MGTIEATCIAEETRMKIEIEGKLARDVLGMTADNCIKVLLDKERAYLALVQADKHYNESIKGE